MSRGSDHEAVVVGVEQAVHGEGVTKVVDTWPACARSRPDSGVGAALEGPLNVAVEETGARRRDEKRAFGGPGAASGAGRYRCRAVVGAVQWKLPG